ncbi:MAG: hypothetical protein HY758_06500 [Nitrospirae bacterium]|nr:hypothetical protein [Nitrospirota bacterium]
MKLILQFPDMTGKIFDGVSIGDFDDPVAAAVYRRIKEGSGLRRNMQVDHSALISECDEEERGLVSELLLEAEFDNPEKIYEDCLKRINHKKRQLLLHELQDKIKKAEFEKNSGLLKNLLHERHNLLKIR